jgi:hypothetical protein
VKRTVTIFTCDRCQKEQEQESGELVPGPLEDWEREWALAWPATVTQLDSYRPPLNPETVCGDCLTAAEREVLAVNMAAAAAGVDDIPF